MENPGPELLGVAVEIQRMLEAGGYKPLPLVEIGKELSMQSLMVMLQYAVGLATIVESHPNLFVITDLGEGQMVSLKGVPWLGPRLPKSEEAKVATVCSGTCDEHPSVAKSSVAGIMQGIPRGKAVEMMGELAEMSVVQEALQEVAGLCLTSPTRTLLVSEIGSKISESTRGVLRSVKLRVAQLLQRFPNDFILSGQGPATSATYTRFEVLPKFSPQPSLTELNSGRYYRLLKLTADVTEHCDKAKSVTAREVLSANGKPVLFVDCRSEAERGVSIIAESVPREQLSEAALEEAQMVVAYCGIGVLSAEWCQERADSPWAYKLRFLSGGVASWAHNEGAFVDPATAEATSKVHCWIPEVAPFFPVAGSGCDVVITDGVPALSRGVLAHASCLRHARLRNLAWEVRLRYWPTVYCIEAVDLKAQLAAGNGSQYLIVDCRTAEERQVSTLQAPGATIIAAEELRTRAVEYLAAYSTIITFCTIGGRSGSFCKRLVDELVEFGVVATEQADDLKRKVVNLLGGVAAWLHAKGGLVDGMGQPTHKLHPWCRAFLEMFPVEDLELVFDEFRPVPQDALSLVACKTECNENVQDVSHRFVQMCSMIPAEVINDSLTRAMESCENYED